MTPEELTELLSAVRTKGLTRLREYLKDTEVAVINAVLDGGADRAIKNNYGKTAFELGDEQNFPQQYLDLLRP
jgi:hypothetical protein